MTLQMLISAVNQEPKELLKAMNVRADAILINQCGHFGYEEIKCGEYIAKVYNLDERGVGLSRNNALFRADGDISLFSDEDIVYEDDCREKVLAEFAAHKEADMLLFNVDVCEGRRTYHTERFGRVRLYDCGRYPAYSFAIRTSRMHQENLCYSLLFGGGAKYSNGEDSLFIRDCIKRGLRVYKTPVTIGREVERKSTWFSGYNEKFFFDRGVLYAYLYGKLAKAWAMRFILAHHGTMCSDIPPSKAYGLMRQGIKDARLKRRGN